MHKKSLMNGQTVGWTNEGKIICPINFIRNWGHNQVIYSSLPIYSSSFKAPASIVFEIFCSLIVLGFNDTSTLVGHFVSSPREREKSDRRDSRRDEREEQGRKRNRNESEETEEIKTFPLNPYLLQG